MTHQITTAPATAFNGEKAPTLDRMLKALSPGKSKKLRLNRDQKRVLGTRDGRIALDVLEHLLAARLELVGPRIAVWFPMTEEAVWRVARALGYRVGRKRCRQMSRLLMEAEVIQPAGSYRQAYRDSAVRSGFRVRLFVLCVGVVRAATKLKLAVGNRLARKGWKEPKTWDHPLFGDSSGLPPPHLTAAQLRRMRSQDVRDWATGKSLA